MQIHKRFIINILASSHLMPSKIRLKLYKMIGLDIEAVEVRAKCYFNSKHITIGKGSFVNFFCQFHSGKTSDGEIVIGEKCFLAMNVNMCAISHEIGGHQQRAGNELYGKIIIGDGTWIGANATILPGVTIGEGCIIAAGSLVNKDCMPNGLYAGVPVKRIKDLD